MRRRRAIAVGAAVAVLAAGGAVAALTWPDRDGTATFVAETVTELPPDPAAPPPRVKAELTSVDIAAPAGGDAAVPERGTERFSMVGVTWSDPAAAPRGEVQVKTRSVTTGKWSGWKTLENADDTPDGAEGAGVRGGTQPLWVGPSDGVAARVAGAGQGLPAGMRLDLIDPDAEDGRGGGAATGSRGGAGGGAALTEEPSAAPSDTPTGEPVSAAPSEPADSAPATTTPAPAPTTTTPAPVATTTPAPTTTAPPAATTKPAATATTTRPASVPPTTTKAPTPTSTAPVKAQFPAYVSRAGWDADEQIVKSISIGTEVRLLWVHHTATGNDYDCADSAKIVKSIQANDVKGKGWSDIGYNYLVDKCGKLFEGRRGGVETPVVGAHVMGFNTNYAGIAVIGDFRTLASNAAIEKVIAQVAAARLGKYDYNPAGSVTVAAGSTNDKFTAGTQVTLQRVAGHRDGDATLCPGDNLYSRLPAIRSLAVEQITGLALKPVTGGGKLGSAYYVPKTAGLSWTMTTPTAKVARFEVWVDGKKVSTLPASARSTTVGLAAGKHSVVVRGVHTSGSTAQVSATVYGDPTAPVWTSGMTVNLRTGTYTLTSVPVTLTVAAKDNLAFAGYAVTAPRAATLGATARSWNVTVKPGTSTYTVTARDVAGNTKAATMKRTVSVSAETSATRTGAWTTVKNRSHLSGKALSASTKGRKLTWTFTGRTAALVFGRTAKSGQVAVYVDGKKVSTLDLKASGNQYRRAVWTRNLSSGKHKIMIEVLGTKGRPTVISDGLVHGN